MKARKVKKLKADGPLVKNMRKVILVRLDELYGFVPAALDPEEVEASHDMRIAAKRLRYILELLTRSLASDATRAVPFSIGRGPARAPHLRDRTPAAGS